jgi:hypothetical protein
MKRSILASLCALFLFFQYCHTDIYDGPFAFLQGDPFYDEPDYIAWKRFELRFFGGEFITLRRNYGELRLFSPIRFLHEWEPFFDLSGYSFENSKWGASVGIGSRFATTRECAVFGINTYYDYLDGCFSNSFHRLGLGAEWFQDCWTIRANGYLPIGRQNQRNRFIIESSGHAFFIEQHEFILTGFDAEVGRQLYNYRDFYADGAIGPYYYFRNHRTSFWGGYARLELNWTPFASIQGRISYDHVNKTRAQAIVQLNIPFAVFASGCFPEEYNVSDSWLTPVNRQGVILTDRHHFW